MSDGAAPNYDIDVTRSALKDLRKIPRQHLSRIDAKITSLRENPRPRGVIKLTGEGHLYRVRVGDYRIIYAVDDAERMVTIARVRERGDAYDNL